MRDKIIIALLLATIALAACLSIQHYRLTQFRTDNSRLQRNVESLVSTAKVRFVRDSLRSLESQALTLKVRELASLRAEDAKIINDLKVRLRDARSLSNIVTVVRDTVYLHAVIEDTIKRDRPLVYRDQWAEFSYSPTDSSLVYSFKDSVTTVLHVRYLKHFLWWRWRPTYSSSTVSHNPRCNIIGTETVIVE